MTDAHIPSDERSRAWLEWLLSSEAEQARDEADAKLRRVAEKLAQGHDITAEDIRVAFNI